jgi:hypothetical protein
MKKKTISVVAFVLAAVTLASCEAPKKVITTVEEEQYSQARVLDVQTKAEIKPIQAEVHVNPVRIEDQWIFSREEFNALDSDLDNLKARASFKTLQKHDADELVAPLFDIHSNPDGSYTVTVRGYIGKIVNWK